MHCQKSGISSTKRNLRMWNSQCRCCHGIKSLWNPLPFTKFLQHSYVMGLPKFNNTKGIGGKPLPPMSLFGEDAPYCCLVVAIQSTWKIQSEHQLRKSWLWSKIGAKGTQICSSFLSFYHPVRMGFHHFESHTSITQRAPRSHHTKVLSKGPGGFCHIRGTKALTTTTTCSTQLRPKPGERWEEMKGETHGFSAKNWRIIWVYPLFSNYHESRDEYLQEFLS